MSLAKKDVPSQDGSSISIPRPRSLIFCSAGASINQLSWLGELQEFDVALVYYGDESITPPPAKYFLANKDFKIPNFIQLARKFPELLDYDYFFFVDDDLIFEPSLFYKWRDIVTKHHLDVSQPSFTLESKADWAHEKNQKPLDIDFDQFVETGCFCLSRHAMRMAFPFFFMAKTGTGLDIAIYQLCQRHNMRSAVIHQLMVYHPHRENKNTVRAQFSEFSSFNPQLSRFIAFCFDKEDVLANLSHASRIFGNTNPCMVRMVATLRFMSARMQRVLKRTFLTRVIRK